MKYGKKFLTQEYIYETEITEQLFPDYNLECHTPVYFSKILLVILATVQILFDVLRRIFFNHW